MSSEENLKDFEILGYKVRLRTQGDDVEAVRAVTLLKNEIKELEKLSCSSAEKILLAALKIAAERVKLQAFVEKELDVLELMVKSPTIELAGEQGFTNHE